MFYGIYKVNLWVCNIWDLWVGDCVLGEVLGSLFRDLLAGKWGCLESKLGEISLVKGEAN